MVRDGLMKYLAGAAIIALSLGFAACTAPAPGPEAPVVVPPTPAPPLQIGADYRTAAEPGIADIGGIPPADLTATPKKGGTLNLNGRDISRFDPCCAQNINVERFVAGLWANGLVRWDLKCNCPAPDLAESWVIAPDGMTYTFKIRQGVKFHNKPPVNGRAVTIEDVRYSIARNSGFELPAGKVAQMGSFFKTLKSIEVVDANTLRITLKQADVNLMRNLMYEYLKVVPKEAALNGDFEKLETLIGSGPFMPTLITNVGTNKFEKNPNYWEQGKPYLDGVTLLAGADAATTAAAFKGKQLDYLIQGYSTAKALLNNPEVRYYSTKGIASGTGGYFMNTKKAPFDNLKVRQAFNLAIDRHQQIAIAGGPDAAYFFGFLGAWQPWNWSDAKWNTMPGYAKTGPAKDAEIEQAKKLMAEAGFANGLKVQCECAGGAGDEVVLQMLKKIGIDMVVDTNASSQNLNEYASYMKDKQLGATSKGGGHIPDFALIGQFLCDGVSNMSSTCDEEIERLHKAQLQEFDEKKRIEFFDKIQQRLFDIMPAAVTTRGTSYHMAYKYARGWRNHFYDVGPSNGLDTANWWLDK